MKSKGANWREFATKKLGSRTSTHKRINKHSDTHARTHSEHLRFLHDAKWVAKPGSSCILREFSILWPISGKKNISDLFVLHGEAKAWTCVLCAHMIYAHSLTHFLTSQLALRDGNTLAVLWVQVTFTALSFAKVLPTAETPLSSVSAFSKAGIHKTFDPFFLPLMQLFNFWSHKMRRELSLWYYKSTGCQLQIMIWIKTD